jgi:phosphopantothenoylcysteine synthetase/decarboxylase
MHILVTAGNTLVPIDRVRCITNVFTGRTGTRIALHSHERGHAVLLLTSHPEVVADLRGQALQPERWTVLPYRTFNDLRERMAEAVASARLDAVIHCAAVSDYRTAGVYAPAANTRFEPATGRWESTSDQAPSLADRAASKVKSSEPELWLRLVRTPKLIDCLRREWGFRGILVKFKLEVEVSAERLLEIAEPSRCQSGADLMVANTLDGAESWAYLGPLDGRYQHVLRPDLPQHLLDAVETLHRERSHA